MWYMVKPISLKLALHAQTPGNKHNKNSIEGHPGLAMITTNLTTGETTSHILTVFLLIMLPGSSNNNGQPIQ